MIQVKCVCIIFHSIVNKWLILYISQHVGVYLHTLSLMYYCFGKANFGIIINQGRGFPPPGNFTSINGGIHCPDRYRILPSKTVESVINLNLFTFEKLFLKYHLYYNGSSPLLFNIASIYHMGRQLICISFH